MAETPKRLKPTQQTLREILLKSGNLCAFPGCTALMLDEDGNFIGQICHIEAAEPGGERFNPAMTNEERRGSSNLLLLCYPHHTLTNDTERYPVAALRDMKASHERRFTAPDRVLRERLARLKWGTLVGAGMVAGAGFDGALRSLREAFEALLGVPEPEPPTTLRQALLRRLQYVTAGSVFYFSHDNLHLAVAAEILEVFHVSGWRVQRLETAPPSIEGGSLHWNDAVLLLFEVKKRDQLANTRKALDDFFDMCGFRKHDQRDETRQRDGAQRIELRIVIVGPLPAGAQRLLK